MKGHTSGFPYEPLSGLNPFEQELNSVASSLEYQAKLVGKAAQLMAYFAGFAEVTSDDIGSLSVYSSSLNFILAVKESKFTNKLAQFTGLNFEKVRSLDGKSIRLVSKFLPAEHPLAKLGIAEISVHGYLPASCKVVEVGRVPIDEQTKAVYEDLIANGRPTYETKCGDEEPAEESPILEVAAEEISF